jgi:hypothetical protein
MVRFVCVSLEAEAFRSRATQCRDVANGTKDIEAQRELRALAKNLDNEADEIESEEKAKTIKR